MRYLGFQSANFAIILRWEANSSYSQKSEFADAESTDHPLSKKAVMTQDLTRNGLFMQSEAEVEILARCLGFCIWLESDTDRDS